MPVRCAMNSVALAPRSRTGAAITIDNERA
jgi:hypothetical protein